MLRKIAKRILFGKKKRNYKQPYYKYVNWHAHNALQAQVSNLIHKLGLQEISNTKLVGDKKDADKFDNQFNY